MRYLLHEVVRNQVPHGVCDEHRRLPVISVHRLLDEILESLEPPDLQQRNAQSA